MHWLRIIKGKRAMAAKQFMTARVSMCLQIKHWSRILKGVGARHNGSQAIHDGSCERLFTNKASVKD